MVIKKETLIKALQLFCDHFDINSDELMYNFILSEDLIKLWNDKYASIPGPLTLYIRRHTHVSGTVPDKYRKLLGLFTGETIANYGGITSITVQINEYQFIVQPQLPDDERVDVRDSIAAVIGNGCGETFWKV